MALAGASAAAELVLAEAVQPVSGNAVWVAAGVVAALGAGGAAVAGAAARTRPAAASGAASAPNREVLIGRLSFPISVERGTAERG